MTIIRNGRPLAFGMGERVCPPGQCEPDPDSVGTGLACWPRAWEPDPGQLGDPPSNVSAGPILGGTLASGQSMVIGQPLASPSKAAIFIIQAKDSNPVLYDARNTSNLKPIWSAYTLWKGFATRATMQPDGNFVVYQDPAFATDDVAVGQQLSSKRVLAGQPLKALWSTGTSGHPGARLMLQDDGNLVVYQGTKVLWSSHTDGFKDKTEIGPKWIHAFQAVMEGSIIPVRNVIIGSTLSLFGAGAAAKKFESRIPTQGGKIGRANVAPVSMNDLLKSTPSAQPTTASTSSAQASSADPSAPPAAADYGPYPQPAQAASAGTTAGVGSDAATTDVRSPTRTATEVRSPTSTSTEVRSPTNTSTEAYTADNFTATVTGGAGAGATTTVNIYPAYFNRQPRSANDAAAFPSHAAPPAQTMKGMLHEVMSSPPPTGVIRGMMREAMTPGTTAGVGSLDHGGGGHGGGGHGGGGHGGGGHGGGWHGGGGRPNFRGRGWGGRGGWGGGWGWGGPWWPYVVVAPGEVSCASWGDPISFPAAILPAARTTLIHAGGDPVAVRGADGGLYLISLDPGVPIGGPPGRLVTVRPCVGMTGVGSADDDVLRAMAIDLLGSIRRTGAPQYATRSVKNFQTAWNTASADTQIATDGKYTRETEGALDAALAALSPASGAAPAAVL